MSYRGNWSPYVPRNLIIKYSKQGDWILDQFLGSGTTLIEAKLLGRNAVGVDINPKALEISKKNLAFESFTKSKIFIRQGSAIDLTFLKDESIDFICTHPPYADIIRYSDGIAGDISLLKYDEFLEQMRLVAKEAYRVLKPNRSCAYMIGDIRQNSFTKPLGMDSMKKFTDVGFILKEIIIKEQHNCRSTEYWIKKSHSFYLLAHEYIFVLEKNSAIAEFYY